MLAVLFAASYVAAALLAFIASPAFPLTIFAIGAIALGGLYLRFIKGTARQELVEALAKRTFNVIEDLKATGRLPPGTDKPVKALEVLVPLLAAHGITFTTGIEDLARAIWSSMHAPDNAGPASSTEVKVGGFQPRVEIETGSKPSARRMGFIRSVGAPLLTLVVGVALTSGCSALTAAEKAAPACYGLTAGDLTTLVGTVKQIALDAAACTDQTDCVAAVEAALNVYIANQDIDSALAVCALEAVQLEIEYPHGGEAAWEPDAGSPITVRSLLMAKSSLSPAESAASQAISNLLTIHPVQFRSR